MIIISPIFSFLGHYSLGEGLIAISFFCQIWVFLPVTELMIFVTWKIVTSLFENMWDMKNNEILFFISNLRNFALECDQKQRYWMYKLIVFLLSSFLVLLSICIVLFTLFEVGSARYPLFIVLFYSVCFCIYKVFLIQFQCWKGLFTTTQDGSDIGDLSQSSDNDTTQKNKNEDTESSVVKLKIWHRFIDDPECNPLYSLPLVRDYVEPSCFGSITVIFLLFVFLFCLVVNINLLIQRFSFGFFFGLVFSIYSAPFLLQFNIFKLFIKRSKFEKHQEMKKIFSMTFIVVTILLAISIFFIIFVNIPNLHFPGQLEYIKPANQTNNTLPSRVSVCNHMFGSFDIFQMIGFSTMIYEIGRNDTIYDNTIKYLFGNSSESIFITKHVNNTFPGKFVHLKHIPSDTEVIMIRGLHNSAEWFLAADLMGRVQIPEIVYSQIPGFGIILPYVEDIILKICEVIRTMFDYRPLVTYYTDPLIEYVSSLDFGTIRKLYFIGHNNGGVFAKMLSMKFGKEAFSVGGSVFSTSIYDVGIDTSRQQLVTNIVSERDFLSSVDNSLGTNYIIPTVNDIFERNCMYSIFCMLTVGCNQTSRFENYCTQVVGMDRYNRMTQYYSSNTF